MVLGDMLVNYLYSAVHMAIEKIPVAGAEIYYDAQFSGRQGGKRIL